MNARKLLLILVLPIIGLAKSYYYPEIRTEVELLPDGDAHIRQERTYSFSGSYSWAFVDLKKTGAENIEFNSLEERTDNGWETLKPTELRDEPASLYVQWSYSAQDEEKTFVLDYTVVGAVKRYEDVADFYWKVIEDEHEPVSQAFVDITLPASSPELFKVYIHSRARPGKLAIDVQAGSASVEQAGIPKDAFVEVRVLTQPGIFPQAQLLPGRRYARILSEEKRNFLVSTTRQYVLVPLGFLMALLIPLVLVVTYYRRYGREPKLDYDAVYEHEPPRMAPPVAVPRILSQKPGKSTLAGKVFEGMFATLLQLAGKGLVTVEEEKHGHKVSYRFKLASGSRPSELDSFSKTVLEFFFGRVAAGDVLTEDMLKQYGKNHPTEARQFLADLGDETTAWWEKELGTGLLDSTSSRAYMKCVGLSALAIAVGVLLVVFGFRDLFGAPGPVGVLVPVVFGVFCLMAYAAAGKSVLRWDPKAYLENQRWLRFKKFLVEFSAIEQAPISLLPIWEQYYVYATALGVAKEFLKNVVRLATERHTDLAVPMWYVAASSSGQFQAASFSQGLANFQSFATNFQSMVSSFSTSSSSGGGFSGGGGGGGGGGSSGAG